MQPYPKQPLIERQAFKELMYFGGGFTAARVCNFFALQGDNFVVGRCLGVEALGFYGRSYGLMSASVSLFGQVLERILFPALTHIQNEQQRLATAYRRSVALVALVMLPVSATLCVLAPEVIHVLLGPVWREVIVPFRILVLGMLFRTTYKIGGALARATRAVYGLAWRHATYAVLVVVGAWIGQHWGLTGVALGVVGALAIHFILIAQLSLDLTEVAWWDFFAAHIPALSLSSVILTALWVVVTVLRELHISPVLMLITSSAIIVIILLVFLQFAPKLAFGRDGLWMLRMLMDYVSDRFVFPSWFKKWSQSKLNLA
jgi:O-antigen/teichoic acid export membrane protein